MRVVMCIPIQNIRENNKPRLNLKTLKFVMSLRRGALFPPIRVAKLRDGNFEIHDGRHRLAAHKLLGKTHIKAYVGIPQEPNPFKPLVHGPDKPGPVRQNERHPLSHDRQTWLEL